MLLLWFQGCQSPLKLIFKGLYISREKKGTWQKWVQRALLWEGFHTGLKDAISWIVEL